MIAPEANKDKQHNPPQQVLSKSEQRYTGKHQHDLENQQHRHQEPIAIISTVVSSIAGLLSQFATTLKHVAAPKQEKSNESQSKQTS